MNQANIAWLYQGINGSCRYNIHKDYLGRKTLNFVNSTNIQSDSLTEKLSLSVKGSQN